MRIRVGLLVLTVLALIFWNLRYGPYRLKRLIDSGCQQAIQAAQRDFQIELDLSEESIPRVEAIAARAMAAGSLTEARREELSKLFGVYLGEVARRYHGGEWLLPSSGPAAGVLLLRNRRGQTSPPARVYQRLGGEGGSLADYYRAIATSQPAAHPADGSPARPSLR
ncbi:MAG: hypothetical protein IT162_17665 [Bryobacterales bacterium]|nr:hypothetical protein [Bryobacterales bacterium]